MSTGGADMGVIHCAAAWGWAHLPHPDPTVMEIHLLPISDLGGHCFHETCACKPQETSAGFWVHNAFDGREWYEQGHRKLN